MKTFHGSCSACLPTQQPEHNYALPNYRGGLDGYFVQLGVFVIVHVCQHLFALVWDSLTLDWRGSSCLFHQNLLFMMLLRSFVTKRHPPPPNDSVIVAAFLTHTLSYESRQNYPVETHPTSSFGSNSIESLYTWKHMEMFPLVGITLAQG